MTAPSPNPPKAPGNGSKIWIAAIALVLVAGIVAIIAARGSGDDEVDGQTGSVQVGDATTTSGAGAGATETTDAAAADQLPEYDATLEADPAIGMTIPTVTGTTFEGDELTIAPDGTAKILLFVAHWCPHCQREVPMLKAHLDDVPMPDDVELVTISTSVEPSADNYPPEGWLADEGWEVPTIADDEASTIARTFGLSAFPYFVAVDADGKVVARASGELSAEEFDAVVAQAQGS
jgi:cytochrome c biogenesis protein CcmG/thiol:disulfide interchange protein DsbE